MVLGKMKGPLKANPFLRLREGHLRGTFDGAQISQRGTSEGVQRGTFDGAQRRTSEVAQTSDGARERRSIHWDNIIFSCSVIE